ncbi:MAG TPA: HAD family hydrolase, partial [Burkholderiales bacterium]
GVLDREVYEARNQGFYQQYKDGTLDIHEFLDFLLKPLSRHPRAQLDAWHLDFMRRKIRPLILPGARELVRRHLEGGDLCAIVTATNSFVTAPIAREFSVEHLLATEPEQAQGEFTGGVAGIPCFREGKVVRLDHWLEGRGLRLEAFSETRFYSDSLNDLPLLGRVSHPVAVDPDDTLRAHAGRHGWPVISLRGKPPVVSGQ